MPCDETCNTISEFQARIHAILQGQNALKDQTVRIRRVLCGLDESLFHSDTDTEEIARNTVDKMAEQEAEIERLNSLLLLNNGTDQYDGCACGGGFIVSYRHPYLEHTTHVLHGIVQCTLEEN